LVDDLGPVFASGVGGVGVKQVGEADFVGHGVLFCSVSG
jgi:hypothetical protein